MTSIHPSRFLRYALIADALACTALAVLQLSLPELLGRQLLLSPGVLTASGIFLALYVGLLIALASRRVVWKAVIGVVVAGNLGWAAGCLALAELAAPSGLGYAYLATQA
jgi:hypothetical protein